MMSQLHRNVFYNIIGVAVTTTLTIIATPFQIKILGLESFGVIGFITTLQVALSALDLGLSSTIAREIAADHSSNKQDSSDLIRSAHLIYWLISVTLAVVIYINAGSFARNWFNPEDIDPIELQQVLQIIAIFLALRWPIAFYTGVLIGMQRLAALNIAKVLVTGIRLSVGIAVLLIWRTLETYLYWLVISAFLETIFYVILTYWRHPALPRLPGFSMPAIRRVWKFSLTMNLLAILGIALAQMDRFAVSLLLPLKELGHYNVAVTAASLLSLTITSMSSATMPQFASAAKSQTVATLASQYLATERVTLFVLGFLSFTLICYARPLLDIWVGIEAAQNSATILILLACGFWLAGLVYNLHSAAVAMARPQIFIYVNIAAIPLYAITLYFSIRSIGLYGAAFSVIILNVYYIVFLIIPVQRGIIGVSTIEWLVKAVLPSVLICAVTIVLPRIVILRFTDENAILPALITLAVSACMYLGLHVFVFGIPDIIRQHSTFKASPTRLNRD
jgi:O-antigen/teichoic acid export membrane protein